MHTALDQRRRSSLTPAGQSIDGINQAAQPSVSIPCGTEEMLGKQETDISDLLKVTHSVPNDPRLVHREHNAFYLPEQIRMAFHRDNVI